MTGTAVAKPQAMLRKELERLAPSYQNLLPKHYPASRLITGGMLSAIMNPELLKCDPKSVAVALARIANLGLDAGETAHLVPFGKTCTMIVDYKGLIRLMCQAGCRKVEAREVREGDDFAFGFGTDPFLRHNPSHGARNAKITYAYAIAWLRGGVTQFEVMDAAEIDALRQRYSKQWKKGALEAWYARKTLLRRLSKYVDRTPQLVQALEDDGKAIDPETGEVFEIPEETPEQTAEVMDPRD